jgi:hypothetical protein
MLEKNRAVMFNGADRITDVNLGYDRQVAKSI